MNALEITIGCIVCIAIVGFLWRHNERRIAREYSHDSAGEKP